VGQVGQVEEAIGSHVTAVREEGRGNVKTH
jgi:hypothetical protein